MESEIRVCGIKVKIEPAVPDNEAWMVNKRTGDVAKITGIGTSAYPKPPQYHRMTAMKLFDVPPTVAAEWRKKAQQQLDALAELRERMLAEAEEETLP